MQSQLSDPVVPKSISRVYDGMFREGSLGALGMGSGKEADAAQECPMLPFYSVQRSVGAVAERVCESSGHHLSVQGQAQYSVSLELGDGKRGSVSKRNSLPSAR
jgi:hypothetical protein